MWAREVTSYLRGCNAKLDATIDKMFLQPMTLASGVVPSLPEGYVLGDWEFIMSENEMRTSEAVNVLYHQKKYTEEERSAAHRPSVDISGQCDEATSSGCKPIRQYVRPMNQDLLDLVNTAIEHAHTEDSFQKFLDQHAELLCPLMSQTVNSTDTSGQSGAYAPR